MDEKFQFEGYWWLPSASDNRLPGILRFDPDEGASLDLMGSLKGLEGIVNPLDPEIILGLSSGGEQVTLTDCARTLGNLRFGSGFATSSFVAFDGRG